MAAQQHKDALARTTGTLGGRLLVEVSGYRGALYVGSSAVLALAGPLGCRGAILALARVRLLALAEPVNFGVAGPGPAADRTGAPLRSRSDHRCRVSPRVRCRCPCPSRGRRSPRPAHSSQTPR